MTQPPELSPRRLQSARELLLARQLRESLALTPKAPFGVSSFVGAQAAVTVLLGLGLTYLSAWPHLVGFAGLGSLVTLFGRFATRRDRRLIVSICALVQTAIVLVMSVTIALGAPVVVQLSVLALICLGVVVFAGVVHIGPPGPLVFVFAAGASMVPLTSWTEVWARTCATAVIGLLAVLICLGTDRFRPAPAEAAPQPAPRLRNLLISASRIAFVALLAALLTFAFGAHHPAWAALGSVAVMQGVHLHISMNRALQRMAGTIVGAALVWSILSLTPNIWTLIVLIAVTQLVTEMVIGYNYALGQIFVTPMALLMSYLAAAGALGPDMAYERVVDTLIGATLGMIMAVVLSTLDDRVFLAKHAKGQN